MSDQEGEKSPKGTRSRLCPNCPHRLSNLSQHHLGLNPKPDSKQKVLDGTRKTAIQVQVRGNKTTKSTNTDLGYQGDTRLETRSSGYSLGIGRETEAGSKGPGLATATSTGNGKKEQQKFEATGKRGDESHSPRRTTGGNTHLVVCPTCSACSSEPSISDNGAGANASLRLC